MEVQFINGERFEDFIKTHARLQERDLQYYINSVVLTAYRKNSIFKLWEEETKSGKKAIIHFNYEWKWDEEDENEYLMIQF